MKVLEVKPLEKKNLTVMIQEKEYNEPFQLLEKSFSAKQDSLKALQKPSIGFYKFVENVVAKVNIDFVTEELGNRSQKEFFEDNILADVFKKSSIPFFPVDIDSEAKTYLESAFDKKTALRDSIIKNIENLNRQKSDDSTERDYLVAYGQSLQSEIEEQEREVNFSVRESWMVMDIMERAREIKNKDEITCLHICSPEHVAGVKQMLESVNANVEIAKLSKRIISTQVETPSSMEMENWLQSMQIQVKPVVGKAAENAPYLLFYLDTDVKAVHLTSAWPTMLDTMQSFLTRTSFLKTSKV